jgi:biotin transport system substrate-specific component
MRGTIAVEPTLIAALWPAGPRTRFLRLALLAVGGSLLLTLSAKTQVPFWPVPMTMQTFAVLAIGMAFGPRLGAATVGLYLLEGAFGLPVFAGVEIGLAYMSGPTGGYLLGMLAAVVLVGHLAGRGWDRSIIGTVAAMVLGNLAIYIPGVLWLGTLAGFDKALALGLTPFLLGDALKVALAAFLLPACWSLIGRKG